MATEEGGVSEGDPTIFAVHDAMHELSRSAARGALVCIAVSSLACVELARVGRQYGHLWLLCGALISGVGLFVSVFTAFLSRGASPKLWRKGALWGLFALGSIGGSLAHAFAFYLAFYRGFWGLRDGVSGYVLFRTAVFVMLGCQLAL